MPGEPVRASDFDKEEGEIGQALSEYLVWVGRQEFPDPEAARQARLTNIRLTPTLIGAVTNKAMAVVNFWLDRNNLRAATFWLQMVMSQLPAAYAEKVARMDRYQVDAEIEAWGRKLGFTPEEARAAAQRLVDGLPDDPEPAETKP
jgi:hypothetical protein